RISPNEPGANVPSRSMPVMPIPQEPTTRAEKDETSPECEPPSTDAACPAPVQLRTCGTGQPSTILSEKTLPASGTSQRMTLRARLSFFEPECRKTARNQGCEETRCEAYLRLVPPGTARPTPFSEKPDAPYLLLEAAGTRFPQPLDTSAAPVAPIPVQTFKCVGSTDKLCCDLEVGLDAMESEVVVTGIVQDDTI